MNTDPPHSRGSRRIEVDEIVANLERGVALGNDHGRRRRVLAYEQLRLLADIADELRGIRAAASRPRL